MRAAGLHAPENLPAGWSESLSTVKLEPLGSACDMSLSTSLVIESFLRLLCFLALFSLGLTRFFYGAAAVRCKLSDLNGLADAQLPAFGPLWKTCLLQCRAREDTVCCVRVVGDD